MADAVKGLKEHLKVSSTTYGDQSKGSRESLTAQDFNLKKSKKKQNKILLALKMIVVCPIENGGLCRITEG